MDERVHQWTTRTMALENKFNMMSVVQETMVTEMRHNYDGLKLRMDEQHRDRSNSEGPEEQLMIQWTSLMWPAKKQSFDGEGVDRMVHRQTMDHTGRNRGRYR